MADCCACGCGAPITPRSPSPDFATVSCQWRWSQHLADNPHRWGGVAAGSDPCGCRACAWVYRSPTSTDHPRLPTSTESTR